AGAGRAGRRGQLTARLGRGDCSPRRHGRGMARGGRRPGGSWPATGPPAPGGGVMSAKIIRSQTVRESGILGIGGYRPARSVPNEEIIKNIDSSDEWIRTRSGIASRRWANDEET